MTDSPAVDTVLQRARTAFANGDILSAFAAAGEALMQAPESQEARVLRVNAALKLERWQDAIAALDPIATLQPPGTKLRKTLAACWLAVANAHRDKRESESAAAAYRKAIQVEPDFRDARFNLGSLLLENGELRHALAEFEAIVAANSTDTAASLKLAEVQLALRRQQAHRGAEQRGLAGAVGSDDGDDLAFVHLQRDLVHGLHRAVGDAEVPEFKKRCHAVTAIVSSSLPPR